MIILYDENERVVFANEQFHKVYPTLPNKNEITDYTLEDLLWCVMRDGQIDHPLAVSDPQAWVDATLAKRRDRAGGFYESSHTTGRTYQTQFNWTEAGGLILSSVDITQRKEMEDVLKASEQQLRNILEDSPIAVAISIEDGSDEHDVVVFSNSRFQTLLGFEADEIGTVRTIEFFDDVAAREEHSKLLDRGEPIFDLELMLRTRRGEEIATLSSLIPIQYGGRSSTLIWIYDISDIKRAQEEIAEKEAQLRLALENMPGAMWLVDKDLKLVFANDQYTDFYGDPDGLVKPGASIVDIVRSEVARGQLDGNDLPEETMKNRVEAYHATSPAIFHDTGHDGRDLMLSRYPAADGHVISVSTDVTALKEAQREITAQRAQLNAILSNIDIGVVMYDSDLRLVTWNEPYPSMINADENILRVGRPLIDVITDLVNRGNYGEGDPQVLAQQRLESLLNGAPRQDLFFDGRSFDARRGLMPDGGVVITYTDITERIRNEKLIAAAITAINQSIEYASRIQRAVLPTTEALASVFRDHFLIWEPKDVVGGDMIWLRDVDGATLLLVADCTGHGVPGAFMTMIATGAVDQAIREVPDGDPAEVIAHMNRVIKAELGQDGMNGGSDDGLELIALRIDGLKLTFAGAQSSLHRYVDGEIEEYKGDKSGIGYRRVPMDQAFTNVEIDAGSDDIFYAWSDGITDQVGGSNRRSFGKRRVCACIDDSHLMTMRQQQAQFLRSFLDHQMQEERRDDITLIGFKLKT